MAIEVKKPTAFTDGSTLWSNETNAYDTDTAGDETTYTDSLMSGDFDPSILFYSWAIKGETYTATVLKIKWLCALAQDDDTWGIQYTDDGGSNWYDLLPLGNNSSAVIVTEQVVLAANQDLTLVQVKIISSQLKGTDGHNVRLYDVWTEGTYEEVTPQLHYRKSGATTDITLYDTEGGTWHDSVRLRVESAILYAQLDSNISHTNASDLRIRVGGTTYTILTTSGTPS